MRNKTMQTKTQAEIQAEMQGRRQAEHILSKVHCVQYRTLRAKQLSKSAVYDFWQEFQKDKLNPVLFFDGEMPDFEHFYAWLTAGDKDARFVQAFCPEGGKGEIKALYWLNNRLGKAVMIHFCFLRRAFCEQEEIGKYVVQSLLFCRQSKNSAVPKNMSPEKTQSENGNANTGNRQNKQEKQKEREKQGEQKEQKEQKEQDEQGEYVLSALIGITPKPYRHALAFIRRLGFTLVCEVPEACFFAEKACCKDAVFSMLTRDLYLQKHGMV